MSEETVLVCMLVTELKAPPVKSRRAQCGICGARVWVAASSPEVDRVWCVPCWADMAAGDETVMAGPLTARQKADIAAALARRAS
jgi:hypothetical protein